MKNLNIEQLITAAQDFEISENNSYINSYEEFINYFSNIPEIEQHHFVIASHFVYGWMPTILDLKLDKIEEVLKLLNKAKSGLLLNTDELEAIKECVNNSMVGTSKLLHFINPEIYAIWDSRIFRYITDKKSSYGIDNPNTYLCYLEKLNGVNKHADYNKLDSIIKDKFKYSISPMRAMEVLMFEADKRKHSKPRTALANASTTQT